MIKHLLRYRFCTVDYGKLADQVMNAQLDNEALRVAVNSILGDMRLVIETAYTLPLVEKILRNVKSKHLCTAAVDQYVGSMYTPRNEAITQLFLSHAKQNARTEEDKLNADYYLIYLKKLDALSKNDKPKFEEANEQLMQLGQLGHYGAKHLLAKEMYKVAMNMMGSKQKKEKEQMLREAYKIFQECAFNEFPHSFYYLGEMAERGDISGGIDLKFALECYYIAAAYDNPQAFFKLAKFHKDGIVCEKDPVLEFDYTKRAAEMGLVDAQHNLGVMYREGHVRKDHIKSLAWFTQAGNFKFPLAMFNAGMMYWEGAEGIQVNRKAALIWFEKLSKTGALDVNRQMKQLIKEIEQEEAQ